MLEVKLFIGPKNIHFPKMLEKCSFQFQRKWSIENSKWKLNHVIFENFDVEIPSRIDFNTFFQIQNFKMIFRQFLTFEIFEKKNRKNDSSFCGHLKNKIQIWQSTKDNFSKITISSCSIKNHRNSWDLNSENFWKFVPKFLIFF